MLLRLVDSPCLPRDDGTIVFVLNGTVDGVAKPGNPVAFGAAIDPIPSEDDVPLSLLELPPVPPMGIILMLAKIPPLPPAGAAGLDRGLQQRKPCKYHRSKESALTPSYFCYQSKLVTIK